MTRRKVLLLALAAIAGVTSVAAGSITAFGADQQKFVLVSNKTEPDLYDPTVHITEYAKDGSILDTADPYSGSKYYLVDGRTAYLLVSHQDRMFRVPQSGTLDGSKDLPACFRMSFTGKLHLITDSCDAKGASPGRWASELN